MKTFDEIHTHDAFADSDDISDYTKEAVNFVFEEGILQGKNGNMFDSKTTATRAEAVVVLHRLIEPMVK